MKINLLILLAAFAALSTFKATAQTAPTQAAAVGFTNLVFNDDFTTTTTFTSSTSATSGYNWYLYPWGPLTASDVTINTGAGTGALAGATGIATINGGVNIQTVPTYPLNTQRVGTWQHGYFEARIQFNPTVTGQGGPSGGWPGFWSFGISAWTPNNPTGYTSECDFFEAYPSGDAGSGFDGINTLHNWLHSSSAVTGTDTYNTDSTNQMESLTGSSQSAQPTDGAWHVYGCLWVQTSATTGYIEYYLDNHLIVHQNGITRYLTGVGTGLTQQELDHMYVILGGGDGWPINVDWVHIFQGVSTGTTAQTVSGFPSTLSLSTSASPYTLPASTSGGLPLTYSVASGPATVSGNTLTLTSAGTVVVNATQAGNATYAAFSGTETITVTALTAQTVSGFPSTLSLSTSASPYTLPATTSAGLTLAYSVTSGPATVSSDKLTITGSGIVVVKATQAGNTTYAPFSGTETITVTALTAQTVSNFPATLSLSTTASPYTLPATTSASLTLAYSVASGPATVSGDRLTLTGPGTVVVNATQAGNATYAAFSGTETITVTALTVQTVSNFPATLSLSTTASPYTLPATTTAGLTLTYSVTSGPATVSGDKLTITGPGTVVVKATQAGNATYAAFSGTETITVTALTAQTVSGFPSTLSLSTNASPYTLPATTSAGLTLTYSVASGPATVSGDKLTLTGAGTVVVNASQAGNSTYAAFSGTETITVAAVTTQTVSNFPATLSLSTSASPYTLPATTSAGLTISYSVTSGPATVSGNTLTLTGAGTIVVKATQAGNADNSAFSATETITVTAATQTVSNFPTTQNLTMSGSPDTLPATTSAGLTITYSVVSGPATISGDQLTVTGTGTVVIKATQAGNATNAPFSATETITVTAATTGGFATWQAHYFTAAQLADPTISGATADPYGSGIPNLLAYALQLNPATAQPTQVPTPVNNNGHLALTYFVPASITDIAYIPEASSDLITWNSGTGYVQVMSNVSSASGNTITVQETLPATLQTHFLHLRVTQVAP